MMNKTKKICFWVLLATLFSVFSGCDMPQVESGNRRAVRSDSAKPTPGASAARKPASKPTPTPKPPAWPVRAQADDLTGEVGTYVADGPSRVRSTRRMTFPYGDVTGNIYAICEPGEAPYIGFGFTTSPNLTGGDVQSGSNTYSIRVAVDGHERRVRIRQGWGERAIFPPRDFVSTVAAANNIRIELPWHGQGSVVYSFNLSGSALGIRNLRARCLS